MTIDAGRESRKLQGLPSKLMLARLVALGHLGNLG